MIIANALKPQEYQSKVEPLIESRAEDGLDGKLRILYLYIFCKKVIDKIIIV